MKNYRIDLAYDGTAYKGWQRLGSGEKTLQGKIEETISEIVRAPIQIIASGRTDAGAHAERQVANFHAESNLSAEEMMSAINANLPEDIAVVACSLEDERFHARYNAKHKTYRYRILDGQANEPFSRHYCLRVRESLDVGRMSAAAKPLIGEHDFSSFTSLKKGAKSHVRRVSNIAIRRNGVYIDLLFSADGFLYNQVRMMAGALIWAGKGLMDEGELRDLLEAMSRKDAPPIAESRGLCLVDVQY